VRFSALAPLPVGSLTVTGRVFYQSTTREFVEALAAANTTDDRGMRLREIWEKTGRAAPRLIATTGSELAVAPKTDGGSDGGSDGRTEDGSPGSDAAGGEAGDGGQTGSGCSCGVAGDGRGSGAAILLALVLAGRRRRATRSDTPPRP
jgi:MYXO-CTERM domain-containing protein